SLAGKSVGELRIIHTLRREQFERNKAVQRLLPRLIDHAHAAAPETFQDFELRKMWRDLVGRQWRLCNGLLAGEGGLGPEVERHEAAWAKAGGRVGRQRRATLRTFRHRF